MNGARRGGLPSRVWGNASKIVTSAYLDHSELTGLRVFIRPAGDEKSGAEMGLEQASRSFPAF